MTIRGRSFPPLTVRNGQGYVLELQVGGARHRVAPPRTLLAVEGDTDVWPRHTYQALVVAAEYCAALQEFLAWSWPTEWDESHKRVVVSYVQSFITYGGAPYGPSPGHAGAVYPPPTPAANSSDAAGANNAAAFPTLLYMVWVAFTYCYFHGCGHVALHQAGQGAAGRGAATGSKDESRMAFDWLNRLVGERGWHPNGPVHGAIQQWVSSMKRRLAEVFPQHDWSRLTAASWPDVESSVRELGERRAAGGGGGEEEPYTPVYPFRVTGGHNNNRVKFMLKGVQAPRDPSGCCGVPAGYSQTHNCALGWLVISDVMAALHQASKHWAHMPPQPGQSAAQAEANLKSVIETAFNCVLRTDEGPLCGAPGVDHTPYRYPSYVAACALGWDLALQQLQQVWVPAAANTAAVAFGVSATGAPTAPLLLLPRCFGLPGLPGQALPPGAADGTAAAAGVDTAAAAAEAGVFTALLGSSDLQPTQQPARGASNPRGRRPSFMSTSPSPSPPPLQVAAAVMQQQRKASGNQRSAPPSPHSITGGGAAATDPRSGTAPYNAAAGLDTATGGGGGMGRQATRGAMAQPQAQHQQQQALLYLVPEATQHGGGVIGAYGPVQGPGGPGLGLRAQVSDGVSGGSVASQGAPLRTSSNNTGGSVSPFAAAIHALSDPQQHPHQQHRQRSRVSAPGMGQVPYGSHDQQAAAWGPGGGGGAQGGYPGGPLRTGVPKHSPHHSPLASPSLNQVGQTMGQPFAAPWHDAGHGLVPARAQSQAAQGGYARDRSPSPHALVPQTRQYSAQHQQYYDAHPQRQQQQQQQQQQHQVYFGEKQPAPVVLYDDPPQVYYRASNPHQYQQHHQPQPHTREASLSPMQQHLHQQHQQELERQRQRSREAGRGREVEEVEEEEVAGGLSAMSLDGLPVGDATMQLLSVFLPPPEGAAAQQDDRGGGGGRGGRGPAGPSARAGGGGGGGAAPTLAMGPFGMVLDAGRGAALGAAPPAGPLAGQDDGIVQLAQRPSRTVTTRVEQQPHLLAAAAEALPPRPSPSDADAVQRAVSYIVHRLQEANSMLSDLARLDPAVHARLAPLVENQEAALKALWPQDPRGSGGGGGAAGGSGADVARSRSAGVAVKGEPRSAVAAPQPFVPGAFGVPSDRPTASGGSAGTPQTSEQAPRPPPPPPPPPPGPQGPAAAVSVARHNSTPVLAGPFAAMMAGGNDTLDIVAAAAEAMRDGDASAVAAGAAAAMRAAATAAAAAEAGGRRHVAASPQGASCGTPAASGAATAGRDAVGGDSSTSNGLLAALGSAGADGALEGDGDGDGGGGMVGNVSAMSWAKGGASSFLQMLPSFGSGSMAALLAAEAVRATTSGELGGQGGGDRGTASGGGAAGVQGAGSSG